MKNHISKMPARTASTAKTELLIGPTTRDLKAEIPVDPFVIDMVYATMNDSSPLSKKANKQRQFSKTPLASRQLIRALKKAHKLGRFRVGINETFGKQSPAIVEQAFDVRVDVAVNADAKKEYAVFNIWLYEAGRDRLITVITVKFGRNDTQRPTRHWIGLQFNPTSLLTGQNIWAAERLVSGELEHRIIMAAYPYIVLARVCEAACADFRTPALLHPRNSSQAIVQNMQFAHPISLLANLQAGALTLIAAKFDTRCLMTRAGEIQGYDIGQLLRVKCRTDKAPRKMGVKGATEIASVLLQKESGDHNVCSVSLYNKPLQAKLSSREVAQLGIADLQRVDVTLQTRGIAKMLTAARQLADEANVEHELDIVPKKRPVHSMINVLTAITMINTLFKAKFDGQSYRGLVDWLRLNVLFKEFHLDEIFGMTPAKLRKLERHFKKLGKRDRRYRKAWRMWRECDFGDADLSKCMTAAGISSATADRQMRGVHDLGFSGKIPPTYWADLKALSLTWGATKEERAEFNRRLDANEPLGEQVAKHHSHLEPTIEALRVALQAPAATVPVRSAPIMRSTKVTPRVTERPAQLALPPVKQSVVEVGILMRQAKRHESQRLSV